jgi:ubiquitin thioesterase protein OTUB1
VVSTLLGFGSLEDEYRDAPGFLEGIDRLKRRYKCMRRVRGDGNCFYRALLFGYVEALSRGLAAGSEEARREHERIINLVRSCPQDLVAVGYDEFTFEIFHEVKIAHIFAVSPPFILPFMYIIDVFGSSFEPSPRGPQS